MPDVWLRYIRVAEKMAWARIDPLHPDPATPPLDLLVTPWSGIRPGEIAAWLRGRLHQNAAEFEGVPWSAFARIASSDSRVVVSATFDMLICYLVPMSSWWWSSLGLRGDKTDGEFRKFEAAYQAIVADPDLPKNELSRYLALVGFIDRLRSAGTKEELWELAKLAYWLGPPPDDDDAEHEWKRASQDEKDDLRALYKRAWNLMRHTIGIDPRKDRGVYLISLNRPASQSLFESRSTVKADAAHRVFAIDTSSITFAVVDGGIDATHPAFFPWTAAQRARIRESGGNYPETDPARSRIKRTYDFTLVRDIVAYTQNPEQVKEGRRKRIENLFKKNTDAAVQKDPNSPPDDDLMLKNPLLHMQIRNNNARDVDWELVAPLLEIPVDKGRMPDDPDNPDTEKYRVPGTDHGTHVAGILAADLPVDPESGKELLGMCPQLALYDLRVFDANGNGDEFAILCALEFVGWLNRDRGNPVVHGVNLSLALAHDVDSFACGQTPICEACNHLVGAGTVLVVAAGNTGFEGKGPEKQSLGNGYRAISITDPGNADSVITVGSTHRRDPHLYGVSYFSARGPTGDGRRKPDLLAPGEKITSTVRQGSTQRMDGTSMASPHVAGAAAMLMARYPELIGRPARIKEILMNTTTDLGREASFQGAGLVDVLRALQSV